MGIIPFQYLPGQTADTLGLTGQETFTVELPQNVQPGQTVEVKVSRGQTVEVRVCRGKTVKVRVSKGQTVEVKVNRVKLLI